MRNIHLARLGFNLTSDDRGAWSVAEHGLLQFENGDRKALKSVKQQCFKYLADDLMAWQHKGPEAQFAAKAFSHNIP